MHHIRKVHFPDRVVLLRMLATSVVERLFRVAVDVLQFCQDISGKRGTVVFTQQLQSSDGSLDLVDPLLDISMIFAPVPLHLADSLQHRFLGHLQELIKCLLLRPVRLRHDFRDQILFLQLLSHIQ